MYKKKLKLKHYADRGKRTGTKKNTRYDTADEHHAFAAAFLLLLLYRF